MEKSLKKFISNEYSNITNESSIKYYAKEKKIICYGHGSGFIGLKQFVLDKYLLRVEIVIDQKFKKNKYIKETLYTSMDVLPGGDIDYENYLVIITVGSLNLQSKIRIHLEKRGFKNIITLYDIYEFHLSYTSKEVLNLGFDYYKENLAQIDLGFNLLFDEKSKNIYKQILSFYISRRINKIECDGLDNHYMPTDVNLNKGYSRVINCGSFDGDTILNIYKKKGKFKSIVCIEPDLINFSKLQINIKKSKVNLSDEIIALPLGLMDFNKYVNFNSNGKYNSSVTSEDNHFADSCLMVSIDSILLNFNPTFINMDIEGCELLALKGSLNILKKNKPDLAISVYHEISHLWEVIIYINSLKLKYKFYLRNYTSFTSETVLYATIN